VAAPGRASLLVGLLLLLLSLPGVAWADPLDEEARRIGKGLQCPVCQGASVADSPSDLATQMRAQIRRKLEQGDNEEQIVAYFVERYGDGVLISPPRRGLGLAVWLAPIGVLMMGAVVLGLVLRRWLTHRTRPPLEAPTEPAMNRNGSVAVAATAHSNGSVALASTVHLNGSVTSATADASTSRVRDELDRFRRDA